MFSSMPPGDPDRPSPARVYDKLYAGSDWYGADRDAAARIAAIYPGVTDMVAVNRLYLGFAAMQARDKGIRQFIDLGGGFPSAGSVRDIAQAHDPEARIAVVDTDSDVAHPEFGYGPQLEDDGVTGVAVIQADITDPGAVLADKQLAAVIDLDEPVALLFGLVLHTMEPKQAREVVAGYADAAPWGSAVVATVARGCGNEAFVRARREFEAATGCQTQEFGRADVAGLFRGLEMQEDAGPVTRPRLAGPCEVPHIAGGLAVKR